jgi:ribosomal protein S18 acetylase RimI-like enzyme
MAQEADAATLAAFAQRVFAETFDFVGYSAADLQAYFDSLLSAAYFRKAAEAGGLWLAEEGGVIAGYAQARPLSLPVEAEGDNIELTRLYIDAPWQGKGVADALMDKALEPYAGHAVWLTVYSENPRGIRFYEKRGFEKVGDYTYYVGNHADAEYIMRRK